MFFFFFKQKTAYELRISDWSSDVCSSDLKVVAHNADALHRRCAAHIQKQVASGQATFVGIGDRIDLAFHRPALPGQFRTGLQHISAAIAGVAIGTRSEEHTSELQSLMRISYAVFCLKKKNTNKQHLS